MFDSLIRGSGLSIGTTLPLSFGIRPCGFISTMERSRYETRRARTKVIIHNTLKQIKHATSGGRELLPRECAKRNCGFRALTGGGRSRNIRFPKSMAQAVVNDCGNSDEPCINPRHFNRRFYPQKKKIMVRNSTITKVMSELKVTTLYR